MITKYQLSTIFEAFSIQRWNDRIRPFPIIEMDKHGLKMIIAYFLGKYEEEANNVIDWDYIIWGGFFALLKNIVLSDIKAPVIARLNSNYPKEMKKLNRWVVKSYDSFFKSQETIKNFETFLNEKRDPDDINLKILKAAHKYSTLREFEIIKNANLSSPFINDIESKLKSEIQKFLDFKGFQELITEQNLYKLLCTIEQLRYQIRWSQTVRMPQTSVLGHSMYVACIALLLSIEKNACSKRLYNNFFSGLFHDLPEAVTRDIISPVKRATPNLPSIIKKIEEETLQEELYPYLRPKIKKELVFFTKNEFKDKIKRNGRIQNIPKTKSIDDFNQDQFSPLDGRLIKFADDMAALMESYQSMQCGIKTKHLHEGFNRILKKYEAIKEITGLNIVDLINEFK